MDEDFNLENVKVTLREFVDSYYRTLGNGVHVLIKFFKGSAVIDQIFIDQNCRRTSGAQNIVHSLSQTYKFGIATSIRSISHQNSPVYPYLIVTVTGLFKYNGNSWPFVHTFYVTASFYASQKFLITNCVLYDCVNPTQITDTPIVVDVNSLYLIRDDGDCIINKKAPTPDRIYDSNMMSSLVDYTYCKNGNSSHRYDTFVNGSDNEGYSKAKTEPIVISSPSDNNETITIRSHNMNNTERRKSVPDSIDDDYQPISYSRNKQYADDQDLSPVESSTEYTIDNTTLFVGSYPETTTQEDLVKLFSKFGPVTTVKMIPQKKIAFITFKNPSSCALALKEIDLRLGDRQLRVQQRKIINNIRHSRRENLELYGYSNEEGRRIFRAKK